MSTEEAIRDLVLAILPGGNWTAQLGRWVDEADKSMRYLVIKPVGGPPAELVRRPQLTVTLIGGASDPLPTIRDAADSVVEVMRTYEGDLINLQAGEPAFMPTTDGRPIFEIAVSAITD